MSQNHRFETLQLHAGQSAAPGTNALTPPSTAPIFLA
jgi:O-acetylhomoserine/O-acetylserine sulfhydrylase-like pyridoxal-dependent enzyme